MPQGGACPPPPALPAAARPPRRLTPSPAGSTPGRSSDVVLVVRIPPLRRRLRHPEQPHVRKEHGLCIRVGLEPRQLRERNLNLQKERADMGAISRDALVRDGCVVREYPVSLRQEGPCLLCFQEARLSTQELCDRLVAVLPHL